MRPVPHSHRLGLGLCQVVVALLGAARSAAAGPTLATLAPSDTADARRAVPLGPHGEVYEPDGRGNFIHRHLFTTADTLTASGRAGSAVVAVGDGVIYLLAPNGWTAYRLAQKGKAVMATGPRAVAAIGRQLFALDRPSRGDANKLALAAATIATLGAGRTIVLRTDTSAVFRVTNGTKVAPLRNAPRTLTRFVGDRFALVPRGAVDLATNKLTPWPANATLLAATLAPDDAFAGVLQVGSTLELVFIRAARLERIGIGANGTPVGLAVDRAGRAVVAFTDGRLAIRDRGTWTLAQVRDELPAAHPGPPAATSP